MSDRDSPFAALFDDVIAKPKRDFVDQPRDEALTIAQAPPAAAKPVLKWRLGEAADLKDEANDPLVLRASDCIVNTFEGRKLIEELRKRIKTRPPITVEVFTNATAMAERQKTLAGASHSDGEGLHGFTRPVSLETLSPSADFNEVEPHLHFIVGIKTIPERSSADRNVEPDFLKFSDPVRLLSMAETIFHEFLHASTVAATARQELRIQSQFLETDQTGHGGDTSFAIDPFTLQLTTEGTVDTSFKQRLVAFVKEAVETFQLRKKLDAEKKEFKRLQAQK